MGDVSHGTRAFGFLLFFACSNVLVLIRATKLLLEKLFNIAAKWLLENKWMHYPISVDSLNCEPCVIFVQTEAKEKKRCVFET